jgi:hypothetical protein
MFGLFVNNLYYADGVCLSENMACVLCSFSKPMDTLRL